MARKSKRNISDKPVSVPSCYKSGVYVRCSLENKKDSIENQILLVKEFVAKNPELELYDIYIDNGETGTNFERPDFERLMSDIKKQKVNCIVVKDLSRFGRNYIETGNYIEKILPFLGVRFIAINDNFDSFKCTSTEEMVIAFKNLINDSYAKDISKKISSVMELKQKKGQFIGLYAPYGYLKSSKDKNKLVLNSETAPIVQDIFEHKLKGYTYSEIADKLNSLNILSPSAYLYQQNILKNKKYANTIWTNAMIKRILTNRVYLGHIIQGKTKRAYYKGEKARYVDPNEWIVVENMHEPIIAESVFNDVQVICTEIEKTNAKPKGKRKDYLLKGIIACHHCKKNFIRDLNGNFYYYRCQTDHQCKRYRLREDVLMDTIRETIYYQINLAIDLHSVLKRIVKSSSYNSKITQLEQENIKLNKKLARYMNLKDSLYENYLDRIMTEQEYLYAQKRYDSEIEAIQEKIGAITKQKNEQETILSPQNKWVSEICKFKDEKQISKEMLNSLVNKIEFDKEKNIFIYWKHQDEYLKLYELLEKGGYVQCKNM